MSWSKRRIALVALLVLAGVVVLLNWTWGRLPGEPERTGRMVRIGDTQLRLLETAGGDSAAPVVLIHGLPGTAQDFEDVVPLLGARRTIAYDRPGYGFSSGGFHPFAEQLATLHALLARLGVRRPVLVGHSYGGALALAYAARYPDDVRGLVLVDAAAGGGGRASFAEKAQVRLVQALSLPVVQPLADLTFSQLVRTVAAKRGDAEAFAPDAVDERHERRVLAMSMRHEDLDAYAGEMREAEDAIAALDRRLPSIETPAIVLQGDADRLVEPAHGRTIAARLPHARLVTVSGGHMPPYLHAERVAAAALALSAADEPARERRPRRQRAERARAAAGR